MHRRAFWVAVAGLGVLGLLAISRVSPASATGPAVTLAAFPDTVTADGSGVAHVLVVATNTDTAEVKDLSLEVSSDGAYPRIGSGDSPPNCPADPKSLPSSTTAPTLASLGASGAAGWTVTACGVDAGHGAVLRLSVSYTSSTGVRGIAGMSLAVGAHPQDPSPTPTAAKTPPPAAASFTLSTNFDADTVLTGDLTSFAFISVANTSPDPITAIEVRAWRPSGLSLSGSGASKDCPSGPRPQSVPQALASQVAAAQSSCIVLVDDTRPLAAGASRTYSISVTTDSRLQPGRGLLLFEVYAFGANGAISTALLSQKLATGVLGESAITAAVAVPVFILIPGFVFVVAAAWLLRRFRMTTFEPSATSLNTWAIGVPASLLMVLVYEPITAIRPIAALVNGPRSLTGPHDISDLLLIWVAACGLGLLAGVAYAVFHSGLDLMWPIPASAKAKQVIEDRRISEEIAWTSNAREFRVRVRSHGVDVSKVAFAEATLRIGAGAPIANAAWRESMLSRMAARLLGRRSGTLTFMLPDGHPASGEDVVVKLPQIDADHPARDFAWVAP